MFLPIPKKQPASARCCRCEKRKLISHFLVLKGNVSKSCNQCLEILFKEGKIGSLDKYDLVRAARRGNAVTTKNQLGRPRRQRPKVKDRY